MVDKWKKGEGRAGVLPQKKRKAHNIIRNKEKKCMKNVIELVEEA